MSVLTPDRVDRFAARFLEADDQERQRLLAEAPPGDDLARAVEAIAEGAGAFYTSDPTRMERVCADALLLAERAGDRAGYALVRTRQADAYRGQGRNADARAAYEEAAAIFTGLDLAVHAARITIGWMVVTAELGDTDAALRAARAARRVLLAHGRHDRVAMLDLNMSKVLLQSGRYLPALRAATAALTGFRRLGRGESVDAAQCYLNRGVALTRLGRYDEARPLLDRARTLARRRGAAQAVALTTRAIGEHRLETGDYASAQRAFEDALARYRALGLSTIVPMIARDLADSYLALNRPLDALRALDEAGADASRIDTVQAPVGLTTRRVAALLMLRRTAEALAVLERAEEQLPPDNARHFARLDTWRAAALLEDGRPREAVVAAEEALRRAATARLPRLAADARATLAAARLSAGDGAGATRAAAAALRQARALAVTSVVGRAQQVLGQAAEARGRRAAAVRHYTAAIAAIEREQQSVIFEDRDRFAATRELPFQRLALLQARAGRPREALLTAERAKSRALAAALAMGFGRRHLRPHRQANRDLEQARADYAALSARLARAAADEPAPAGPAIPESLIQLERQIERLRRHDQITTFRPALSSGSDLRLPRLDTGALLVEYFAAGADLLRFEVEGDRVAVAVIPDGVTTAERLVRLLRASLDLAEHSPPAERGRRLNQTQTLLSRLYDLLLRDAGGIDRCVLLAVVPHGILHHVPFHALHDGAGYLVERMTVTHAPSAALLAASQARGRGRARGPSLVLGYADGGRLPGAVREAEIVARLLATSPRTEAEATRTALLSDGRLARLVHIAAHARFRPDAPLFSTIELADGSLTTADVFDLELRAELVVLSACETGRASVGGGDEVVGMARAFLVAGAAGLITSQWRVDDVATEDLMTRFYRGRARRGVSNADALCQAQRGFLRDHRETEREHPFFWAGLQFVGAG